ncbi:MAG: hypothetical protein ACO33A_09625 [Hyphomonas sp.]
MAHGNSTQARGRSPVQLLAALALALAFGLLAWRSAGLLTRPGPPAAASLAEAALADILAPVAGPGLSRVSLSSNAGGGRTLLLLIDESAAPRLGDLQRIAPVAAGLSAEAGDRLVIETVPFAPGLPGRPDLAAWTELAALAALVLLAGLISHLSGRSAALGAPAPQILSSPLPGPHPAERLREPVRAIRPVPAPGPAAEIARRDPVRAAAVVRGWMRGGEET